MTHVCLQLKMIEWKNSRTKQLTNELLTFLITVTRCLTSAAQEGRGFSGFQLKDMVSPSWKGSHSGRSWRYQAILPLQSGRRERDEGWCLAHFFLLSLKPQSMGWCYWYLEAAFPLQLNFPENTLIATSKDCFGVILNQIILTINTINSLNFFPSEFYDEIIVFFHSPVLAGLTLCLLEYLLLYAVHLLGHNHTVY